MIKLPNADVPLAPRTVAELIGALERFQSWIDAECLPGPWSLHLPLYARHLLARGASMRYAEQQVYLLQGEARRRGEPLRNMRLELRALRRELARTNPEQLRRTPAPAIMPEHMADILRSIERWTPARTAHPEFLRLRDAALVLTAWGGALRASEVAGIALDHLTFSDQGAALYLPLSKADQTGEGATIVIARHVRPDRCAVHHLEQLAPLVGETRRLFTVAPHGAPLSARSVRDRLTTWAASALPGASSHSYRAGWITTAAQCRIPEHLIAAHSRHKSEATMRAYIRRAHLWDDAATHEVTRRL